MLDAFVIVVSLAGINGMIITSSRLTYAMGQHHRLFRSLAKTDTEHGTPYVAIALISGLSALLVWLGTFHRLLFFTGVVVWLFFALITGSLFILRRKDPERSRPYRVWGYPFTPLIFLGICVMLFMNTVMAYPIQSLIGLVLVLVGVPVYLVSGRLKP